MCKIIAKSVNWTHFIVGATVLLLTQQAALAALAPVDLGTAATFAVLAGTEITVAGPVLSTTIAGDIGATSETGFENVNQVSGVNHGNDAVTAGARLDLTAAYIDAAGRVPNTVFLGTDNQLGGQTLVSGVYRFGHGDTANLIGSLTLNGQGNPNAVWIFQATSDLVTASASSVILENGAQACNVFWQVTSSATLGTTTDFVGSILALTAIGMNTGAILDGQALARNAAVTLDNNTITVPVCEAVPESSTVLAGALLLLPVGMQGCRQLRKRNRLA